MQTHIDLVFADGEYTFRYPLAQILAIQDKCGCGIFEIYHRLASGTSRAEDCIEVLRHGLIGGKGGVVDGIPVEVNEARANQLVRTYIEEQPLSVIIETARAAIDPRFFGYEPVQKKSAHGTGTGSSTEQP